MAEAKRWEERVWAAVRRIPRGQVATYGEIGVAAGCTARQVGSALRRAGDGLRLPWHRVVAAQGRIALPGDAGLEQRLRLEQEGVPFRGNRALINHLRKASSELINSKITRFPAK